MKIENEFFDLSIIMNESYIHKTELNKKVRREK
jgi:hypothetical protein